MLGKSNATRGEQYDSRQTLHDQHHANFASVQPSKHPLDLSSRNRNLSLNDFAPIPAGESKMKESVREDSTDHSGKEVRKLRIRVEELEKENMTLHKLIIEYEQEMKDWQQKATRLNEQLINYQNKQLAVEPYQSHYQPRQLASNEQELRQYKNTVALLQEANRLNTRKISDLTSQLQKCRRQSSRSIQMETLFHRLQADLRDTQQRLEKEEIKNKQNQNYIDDLEKQLQFMSKQIPQQINSIERQKSQINEREKKQFLDDIKRIQSQLQQTKRRQQEQTSQKQNLSRQNNQLRQQIQKLSQSKPKASAQLQQLYEEIIRLKQKSYEEAKHQQEEQLRIEKQQNRSMASLIYENTSLKSDNQRLKEQISQKVIQLTKYQSSSIKISKIQEEKIIAKSQIFKETNEKNTIYREQIRKLTQQNESMLKQIKEVESFYMLQLSKVKQEGEKYATRLQRQIQQMKQNQQRQQKSLNSTKKLKDGEIEQLQKLIHQQETNIEAIHTRYCTEIDKIMSQNAQMKKSFQQMDRVRIEDMQLYENKLKQYNQNSYTANMLKVQIQQLNIALHHQQAVTVKAEQKSITYLQENQLISRKMKQYQLDLQHLAKENQRWKAYRLSEQDEARRETRRYKKKVQELELLLQHQTQKNAIGDLQSFQRTIEALKQEMMQQELSSKKLLEVERLKLNQAIDEMEKQMHNILKECDSKINQKQSEIILLHNQINGLRIELKQAITTNQELKNMQAKASLTFQQMDELNEKLKKQLLTARNQTVRIQSLLKKQESQFIALKYQSEAKKEIRNRYDKDMQQKVTEIQRLKLQTAQLSDEMQRKGLANKKQIQALELALRSKEQQGREAIQRNSYLESMTETYKAQNKRFKQMVQKQKNEKQTLQSKVDQFLSQLNSESAKLNRLKDEKSQQTQQYQCEAHEWKDKWETSVRQIRKLEFKLSQISREQQSKQNEVSQSLKQLAKMKTQLQDSKQKCEWLQERLNQSSREGTQLKNVKETILQMSQKEANYQQIIESQKLKIQALTKDQGEKTTQIQILLQKINQLQKNVKKSLTQMVQVDRTRLIRMECYQNICNLNLTNNNSSKLIFDGDQQRFLKVIKEYLRTFSSQLNLALEDISKKQRLILELNSDKENLNFKYIKYKNVALDYKNKKQLQKHELRNTYRFNQEIIQHCQGIIKGSKK